MSPIDAAVKVADDRLHWVAVIRRQPTNGRYGSEAVGWLEILPAQIPANFSEPNLKLNEPRQMARYCGCYRETRPLFGDSPKNCNTAFNLNHLRHVDTAYHRAQLSRLTVSTLSSMT